MKNQQTKPPADDFRATYMSSRGAQLLGEHALGLPAGHPVRETIHLLLERWAEGKPVIFRDGKAREADPGMFEGLAEVMEAA